MNSFEMKQLLVDLKIPGPFLFRRDDGHRAFLLLERQLKLVSLGRALILDFDGIAVMDTSFADETVVELAVGLADLRYDDRYMVLNQPSPATIDNLEGAVARRTERIMLLIREGSCTKIIGRVEANLVEAWDLLQQNGEMTARRLADQLGLQINTASMRLHKLYVARLAARREEITPSGRSHVYELPA